MRFLVFDFGCAVFGVCPVSRRLSTRRDTQTDRQRQTETDGHTNRQTDRQTDRQTHTHTDKHTHTHTHTARGPRQRVGVSLQGGSQPPQPERVAGSDVLERDVADHQVGGADKDLEEDDGHPDAAPALRCDVVPDVLCDSRSDDVGRGADD
eukprot:1773393-Rhodomonas_salina.1